jgi:hypothetical protein
MNPLDFVVIPALAAVWSHIDGELTFPMALLYMGGLSVLFRVLA